jgi:hypothetical protein
MALTTPVPLPQNQCWRTQSCRKFLLFPAAPSRV